MCLKQRDVQVLRPCTRKEQCRRGAHANLAGAELEGKSERQGSAHGPAVAGTAMKGLDCTQLKRRYGGVRVEKKYLWLPLAMFTHFHMEKVLEWGVQTVWKSDRGQEETLTIQVKNNCALD